MKTIILTNKQAFELASAGDKDAVCAILSQYKGTIFKQIGDYTPETHEEMADVENYLMMWVMGALRNFDINRLK